MSLLTVNNIQKSFGPDTILDGVGFRLEWGQKLGLVGRNGSGKTSLFNLLVGKSDPTMGVIARQPGIRISLLEQHRDFDDATTVWEGAAGGCADLLKLEASLGEQSRLIGELGEASSAAMLERYDRDLHRFEHDGGYELPPRVDAVLHGLGFDPEAARTRQISELSGGERGRLGLARQLINDAQVLLLDEPTNHLDLDTTRWLESFIASSDKTLRIVDIQYHRLQELHDPADLPPAGELRTGPAGGRFSAAGMPAENSRQV